jgi:uncharacterized protein YndB with AHSA1/START domain
MPTGTVRLHRVLRTTPEKAYRAFTHGAALAKWLPPYGFVSHAFGGQYLKLTPGELIEYTDAFDDPNLPGEMHVTVKLRAVSCGTEVHIEQAGIPEIIPTEACYLGWQESLAQLAQLVEPEITE